MSIKISLQLSRDAKDHHGCLAQDLGCYPFSLSSNVPRRKDALEKLSGPRKPKLRRNRITSADF
jgi:hypothetical protein